MKLLIIMIFSILRTISYSQGLHDIPNFMNSDIDRNLYWKDSTILTQKQSWNNGKIKLEYIQISDSTKLRKEYYVNGKPKIEVEVYQIWINDTTYDIDPETGITEMLVDSGFVDILNGNYKGFYNLQPYRYFYVLGNFKNNIQIGEWELREPYISFAVMTYDSVGNPNGSYNEYYYNTIEEDRKLIKWKGQFGKIQSFEYDIDPSTGETIKQKKDIYSRIGTWSHYDISGNLLEEVKYEWIKK